jgi:transcriptional regulator with XRE-family HTH domain
MSAAAEALAPRLRKRRTDLGLTQEELAARCERHPTEISRLERGVRDPRLSTLVLVARALETRPSALLMGIE